MLTRYYSNPQPQLPRGAAGPQAECQQEPVPCTPLSLCNYSSSLQTGRKRTSVCFMSPAGHQSKPTGSTALVCQVSAAPLHAQVHAYTTARSSAIPRECRAHPHCHCYRKTPADLFWLSTHEVVTKSSSTCGRQKTWTSAKKPTSPRSARDSAAET